MFRSKKPDQGGLSGSFDFVKFMRSLGLSDSASQKLLADMCGLEPHSQMVALHSMAAKKVPKGVSFQIGYQTRLLVSYIVHRSVLVKFQPDRFCQCTFYFETSV